jgi:phosphoenolpyruvate-protein kinase (PTS system EI component)
MEPSRDQQATAVQPNTPAGLAAQDGTADGRRVALLANIASAHDVAAAIAAPKVSGCTAELCFSTVPRRPRLLSRSAGRAVFPRWRPPGRGTHSDAGKDKQLAFLSLPRAERPWRARIPRGVHPAAS